MKNIRKSLLILLALFAFGPMAWAQNNGISYIDASGNPATCTSYIVLDDVIAAAPNTDKTIGFENYQNWFVVQGSDVVLNGRLGYNGHLNLILCDGAKLTVNKTGGNAIQSLDNTETKTTLTIYVQSNGTGQLVANATNNKAIQTENLTIHGGVISATGGTNGIHAPNSDIVINGGTVTALAPNGDAIEGYNVTINGGIVSATGGGGIKNGMTGTTTLGYTNNTDRITATNYLLGYTAAQVKVKDGQYMITDNGVIVYGSLNENKINAIAGHTLSPYIPTEWEGLGTAQSPYIIDSEEDLILLSLRTNGGSHHYRDTCFKLGANITFNASSEWNDATSTESNFTAIGSFSGHFDGDVYTISGLRIRKDDGVGLFSYLAEGAVVENITLNNSRVTGNSEIGGIVGRLQSGATVNNCHVTNTVYVYSKYHYTGVRGGVVGYNDGGTISNCVSEATIGRTTEVWDNTNDKAGGIVGVNESGTLTGNLVIGANITCYTENYGAIAGNNESGTLSNNYYRACTVNGTANATGVGCNGADVTTNDGALSLHTITKPNDVNNGTSATLTYNNTSYWAQGKNITLSGGLGDTPTEGWQKAYCINDVALQENSTTIKNNFDMPAEDVTITIGEIHADWAIANGGTQADPYKIYFNDQLDLLATRVNAGNNYSGEYFQLMDDLTYDNTEQNNYIAIGTGSNPFSGHFDGNQKTINGIRIYTNSGYQGVFGYIVNAEVKDLYVNDIEITAHDRVGCLVGECDGSTISNCRVTTATLNNTGGGYSDCPYFGGIAGRNLGTNTMSNNFVLGVDIPQVYHFGAIAGDVGFDQGLVSNYYHNCSVSGTAYAMGIGRNGGDVTTNDGALPVFTVSVADGVTASATATVTHNTVNYYKKDVPITLSGGLEGTPGEGLQKAYVVYGETLTGSNLAPGHEFDMQNANAVVAIGSMPADWAVANEGTQADPYKIYYTDQLDQLAARVNNGTSTYSNKYFKLMDDLTYSYTGAANENNYTAIGNGSNPFSGHFDGNQKTIEGIRIYSTGGYLGVFGYINNAEVKDLYVDDIVITGHDRVGCIVGECDGSTAITGCRVTTATLNATEAFPNSPWFGGIAGRKSGSTSTMSNNFVLGLTIPQAYHFGAIAGENSTGAQSMVSNHYHNCTVGSTAYPTGVGCNGQDVEGAKAVFTLTLADGISSDASPVVNYNTVDYCVAGVTINLSYVTPANPGYRHIYSVNSESIEGDSFVLNANATVTVAPNRLINWETEYAGTEADPYLISNVEQWDYLASNVSISGITYSGKFFKLMENISVTTMVGSHPDQNTYNSFNGTFDGDGHTLNLNISCADNFCGPFRFTYGATIKNLITTGTITTTNQHAGGVVGRNGTGNLTLTNVKSSVVIDTRYSGDAQHGGLVGYTINADITGCAFTGRLLGGTSTGCSGLIGWKTNTTSSRANITDCIFAPAYVTVDAANAYTLARNSSGGVVNVTNCYYTETLGTAQGKLAHSITGGENVTVEFAGDVTTYNVSEITTNGTGIKYGDMLYAGNGDNVNLTLGAALGYSITSDFSVNAGALNHYSEDYYTLIMPTNDQDVIISATTQLVAVYREIAGYHDTQDRTKWVFIASPVSGSVAVGEVGNLVDTDATEEYNLYRFNQAEELEWENYKAHNTTDFTTLVNGRGYLYASKNDVTLTFTGPFNLNETETMDLDYTEGKPFAGWNLVGNPFPVRAYITDRSYYKISEDGTRVDPTEVSGAYAIDSCSGVMVKANATGERVTFSKTAPEAVTSKGNLQIALSQVVEPVETPVRNGNGFKVGPSTGSGTLTLDKAIVSFNEGSALGKFYFGTQNANIYIPQGGEDYAIVNVSRDVARYVSTTEIPVNFKANADGQYTISVNPEGVEMGYLHLIDNMTGADIDLLAATSTGSVASYTFTAKTTDYESRFKLVFSANNGDGPSTGSGAFAFYSDGNWIINNEGKATLQVIDLNGRILSSETVNGSVSKSINAVSGVYMLRLINGENVRVQKIVVR